MTNTASPYAVFLDYCDDIKQICQPLFDYLPIRFFRYVVSYRDNTKFVLCTDKAWLEDYFNQQFYMDELANFAKHPENSSGLSIHSANCGTQQVICEFWAKHRARLNYDDIFCTYEKFENFMELYNFGFSQHKHTGANIFLNNKFILDNFLVYFKDKAQEIILDAQTHKFSHPPLPQSNFRDNWLLGMKPENINELMAKIKPSRIYLEGSLNHIYLTPIESQCLKLILQGNKYKAISHIMSRSPRTIESYAAKIKDKFKVRTKTDLLLFCSQNRVLEKLQNL